ncbi:MULTISPECIES: SDH family Clp fold serine proteinase [Bartonella]|uniref:SDH family Clp fold serine proteinase n=1 Tax=Bartonella TaxID=773 RepID=UPI0018DDB3AC|nr:MULTISPECIES: hypothetical protein [Bartonella]MBI0168621.1 SppA protein [Bartonella sp. W8167]MBI0175389.1 SppA protein [Bartonella apis]
MGCDVYYYCGAINYPGYWLLTKEIKKRKEESDLNKSVILGITTLGGDPDAGYRIGRALQHNYEDFSVLISSFCKSAGTLLAIAANKLIIGDTGELGPLDIQIKKNDELDESNSGLDIMTALNSLQAVSADCFAETMKSIHDDTRINAKLSGDMAAKIIEAMISPITAQIDPIKFGEHQRILNIATRYGANLNQKFGNLKPGVLNKIIANYPSHGYVIDRKEARELFKRVVEPETREIVDLYDTFYSRFHKRDFSFQGIPQVEYFCELSENCDEQYGSKEEECDDERGHEGTAVANGADKKTDSRANKRNKKGSKQNDPIPDQAEQIN